ncbi:MAG: AAA domain-containing protein [Halodesulfurarchaeum sp.]
MTLRGTVTDVGEVETVETESGDRDVSRVGLRTDGTPATLTLWGKWTKTISVLEEGMELAVTDVRTENSDGYPRYSTTAESYVIVEPDYLLDVTDLRSWVQCPRAYYLEKLSGLPLEYPVTRGTIVHEVFGDLLRGADLSEAVESRVDEAGLEIGLLSRDRETVVEEVRKNALAIQRWLDQGVLDGEDEWRSEVTLISDVLGIKGRCDAIRRGMPVELKTGKNTGREPRFPDKVQAAAYALLLEERGVEASVGTLLYTKNGAVDRSEVSGDLSPAKEFTIGRGLLEFVVRTRNEIAAIEHDSGVPTGYEGDATCEYCFEQDTCLVVSGKLDQRSKAGRVGEALPGEERSYFESTYEAIERERRHVHREYAKLFTQSPSERADADRALIDLEPAGQEQLPDGRWRLSAERTAASVSKIREGDTVLASDGDPIDGRSELATVETLGPRSVSVTVEEPLPLCRLDVYPSEMGVDRMLTALTDTLLRGSNHRKDVLFGRAAPQFETESRTIIDNDSAQNRAVNRALNAEDFALIHGPPGTGKTYTIAHLIRALVERGDRVLLAGFTNRSVDNALEALREQGFEDAVRVGTETGVRADMQDIRLARSGGPDELAAALEEAPVVASTTATCGSRIMRTQDFDVVVVDEASQLTEPDTLAAINLGERFVLVGDHHQLPPVVGAAEDLATSLFERLIDEYPEAATTLDRQYRMRQRIQAFPSTEFYAGALRPANEAVASQTLANLGVDTEREDVFDGVAFVQVDGTPKAHTDTKEAERVDAIVTASLEAGLDPSDIGVIAPFRAQVATIGNLVPSEVAVDTVDRFQGSSKEVIVLSLVATDSLDGPIFEDVRRMNVALTRAKKSLVIVGDRSALESDDRYARMLEWANR